MKKKKTIIIFIIIAIIIAFITTKLISDFTKETKIKDEIKEISKVFKVVNIDDDEVNEILNRRIIKSGPYKDVEDSIKKYYQNVYSNLKNLTFLLDDDNFSIYLSGDNLKEDKPNFTKSKDNLLNTKAQIDEYYNLLTDELDNKQTKIEYILDKDVSPYYQEFYLELTSLAISNDFNNELSEAYENTITKIDIYNEALDFLITNKGHWSIKDDVIIFDDTVLYEEYINITKKLEVSES